MNERIKQLAIQAGFFYEDYKDIWYLEYHNQSCEEEMKKFAELIVRECKELLFESSENNRLPIAVDDMAHIIDTHFGVEE